MEDTKWLKEKLQLSRGAPRLGNFIKKLLNKPVVRETCYYRKLTDRGKDDPVPSSNEAEIENLIGNRGLIPSFTARSQSEASGSGNLIVYNGAMVDVGSMMQKLEKSEKAREEIEQKLMLQDAKKEENAKVKLQLEQANNTLSRELEEVRETLRQTEETLRAAEEKKTLYHELIRKSANSLTSTVKGLMEVLDKDQEVDESAAGAAGDHIQTNGSNK